MPRFFISISLLKVLSFNAFAQNDREITGKLMSENDEPLPFATVAAYKASDTTLIDYVLTEGDGSFRIKKLPLNTPLRVIISYLGYEPIKEDFQSSI